MPSKDYRPPTHQKILKAAIDFVVDHGFANLTIAKVAERAGIAYGNLTYYFPTREHLVAAVFDYWVEEWRADLIAKITAASKQPGSKTFGLINALVYDAVSRKTSRLSAELWVVSQHDQTMSKRIRSAMDEVVDLMTGLLGVGASHVNRVEVRSLLYFLLTISQGVSMVWSGTAKASNRGLEMADLARETIASKLDGYLHPIT